MYGSLLFGRDDWDINKRVLVLTRFPEDEAKNLTVDFFTCVYRDGLWNLNSTNTEYLTGLCLQVKVAFEDFLNGI